LGSVGSYPFAGGGVEAGVGDQRAVIYTRKYGSQPGVDAENNALTLSNMDTMSDDECFVNERTNEGDSNSDVSRHVGSVGRVLGPEPGRDLVPGKGFACTNKHCRTPPQPP
jgi:hypothetical protein